MQIVDMIISPTEVAVVDGFNPRSHFDSNEQKLFNSSVGTEGKIHQPLWIRDNEGVYELIAGERRLHASLANNFSEIPIRLYRDISDQEAATLAEMENIQRKEMPVMDEARAVQRQLGINEGDKSVVSAIMGISVEKINQLTYLLNCEDEVQQALTEKKIKLGHAVLLAKVNAEVQRNSLIKCLDEQWTVSELKKRLEAYASKQPLTKAIFDTAECQGCHSNSSVQVSLLDHDPQDGMCANPTCYEQKRTNALEQLKQSKQEEYPVLFMNTEIANDQHKTLFKDNVGKEQFDACQSCAHLCAVMDTRRGHEGSVNDDQCKNLDCLTEKENAHQKNRTIIKSPDTATKAKPSSSNSTRPKAKADALPKRVKELNDKAIWKRAGEVLSTDERIQTVMLIDAMINTHRELLQRSAKINDQSPLIELRKKTPDVRVQYLLDKSLDELKTIMVELFQYGFGTDEESRWIKDSKSVLVNTKSDFSSTVIVDKEYLKAHTKKMISSLLKDAGFDVYYNNLKGDGAFKKLMNEKHPDIVSKVCESTFSFVGFVPSTMNSITNNKALSDNNENDTVGTQTENKEAA